MLLLLSLLPMTVFANDELPYPTLSLGEATWVDSMAGTAYFQFTPSQDGWYTLKTSQEDIGSLRGVIWEYTDGDFERLQTVFVDVGAGDHLYLPYELKAGTTYRYETAPTAGACGFYLTLNESVMYMVRFHAGEGVFFDSETGNETKEIEAKYAEGARISSFPSFLLPDSGRMPTGWALNSDAVIPEIQHWDYKVTGDTDLYAIYGDPITITYDCNGGYCNYYEEPTDSFVINTGAGDWFSDNMAYYPDDAKVFLGWYSDPVGGTKYSNDDHMMETTTVYAHWEEPIVLTYDANGGTFPYQGNVSMFTYQYSPGETFMNFAAEHPDENMQFAGYYTEPVGGDYIPSNYAVTENMTVYVHWMKLFAVTFDANGGYFNDDPDQTTKAYNNFPAGERLYPPVVQNADSTLILDGWYDDRTEGRKYESGEAIMDPVTLYAHWIQGKLVTFDANGGYFKYSEETTRTDAFLPGKSLAINSYIYKGELVHSDQGKILVGWATKKDATKQDIITGTINVDDVTTLYAIWEDGIKITEVAGDGYFTRYNSETGQTEKNPSLEFYAPVGSKVSALSSIYSGISGTNYYIQAYTDTPRKKDFGDRSLTEDGPIVATDYVLTEDTVLYVVWKDTAIITFDAGDGYFVSGSGSASVTQKTSEREIGKTLPINYGDNFDARSNDANKVFVGWSETGSAEDIITSITATGDMTLHAVYKTGLTVTLEPTGGIPFYCRLNGQILETDNNQAIWPAETSLSDLSFYCGANGSYSLDHVFVGLSTTADGSNLIDDSWYPAADTTLYVVFMEGTNAYFHADPGTFQSTGNSSLTVSVPKGETIGEVETPVYSGHTFVGWKSYRTNEMIDPKTFVPTEGCDYLAIWEETVGQNYTITFVDEDGTVLKEAEYPEGTAAADIVRPADPTKPADAQYTYIFTGWTPAITDVTADTTYVATYTKNSIVETPVASLQVDPIRVYEGIGLPVDGGMRIPYTVTFKDGTTQRAERRVLQYDGGYYYLNLDVPESSSEWKAGEVHSVKASILDFSSEATIEVYGIDSIEVEENDGLKLFIHQTNGETVEANVNHFYVMAASGDNNGYGSLRTDKGVFTAEVINYKTGKNIQVSIGGKTSNTLSSSKWFETNRHALDVWYLGVARNTSFNGIVNKDNIDRMIYVSQLYYLMHDSTGASSSETGIAADAMKQRMRDLFVITADFDISLSSYYDAKTDMIVLPPGGLGGNFDCQIISTDTEQGYIDYASVGPEKDMKVLFDENYKIKQFGHPSAEPTDPIEELAKAQGNGWFQFNDQWYYAVSGKVKTGWQKSGSTWYYMDPDNGGAMATGLIKVGNTFYYMNNSGVMQTGWIDDNGTWYYGNSSGALATGWTKVGTTWYYMDPATAAMQTGFVDIGTTTYYMASSGAMQTGWIKFNNNWFFADGSGAIQKGWVKDGTSWYYMSPMTGAMQRGLVVVDGATYYMAESGAMQTGWIKYAGNWYFANSSGAIQKGWVQSGGSWYYMDETTGIMKTGFVEVGSATYFMAGSGAMQTGWIKDNDKWYFANSSGAIQKGWVQSGGSWYYMDKETGEMQTGWVKIGGSWYYMNSSGAMQTGWVKIGATWYYFGSSGAAYQNGIYTIGTTKYAFTESCALAQYVLNTSTHKFHYPTCKDVEKMDAENMAFSADSRASVVVAGYDPCGHCKP